MGVQKKQPDEIVEPVQEQVPVIEAPAEPTPEPIPEPEPKKAGRPKKEKKPRSAAQLANDEKQRRKFYDIRFHKEEIKAQGSCRIANFNVKDMLEVGFMKNPER